VKALGYKELNSNLGCPYPMVTKCGMGSGLISDSKKAITTAPSTITRFHLQDVVVRIDVILDPK
jgi:hypothetical protein